MAFTPVIIGVADVKNQTDEHKEPATLMLEAITGALADTGVAATAAGAEGERLLRSAIDSIDVVRTWTWPYADLPGLLAERLGLGARPRWTRYTETHGGNQPARLVDEAAGRIARGETTVAVVTGGEALASCEFLKVDLLLWPTPSPISKSALKGNKGEKGWGDGGRPPDFLKVVVLKCEN